MFILRAMERAIFYMLTFMQYNLQFIATVNQIMIFMVLFHSGVSKNKLHKI